MDQRVASTALVLVSGFLAGCFGDSSGSLTVRYRLGTGETCEENGIADVRFRLENSERDSLPTQTMPCAAATGSVEFGDIPADIYTLVGEGRNADEHVVFDAVLSNVKISDGRASAVDLWMWAVGMSLELEWRFTDGRLCSSHSVETLHIVLVRNSARPVYEDDIPCIDGGVTIGDLEVGTYDLVIWGLNAEGVETYSYEKRSIEVSAAGTPVEQAVLVPSGSGSE